MTCEHELVVPTKTSDWKCELCGETIGASEISYRLEELDKYKKGFAIMMEYFDSIYDEEKPKVDRALSALGL